MDLSCHENRLNERYGTWLMPGEEMHETPLGDVTQDHCARNQSSSSSRTALKAAYAIL